MVAQELLSVVPVHMHAGRRYFIRIRDIPESWRGQFIEALRGSACPVLLGETEALAYVWDWEAWVDGRWIGRLPPAGCL